MVRDECVCAFRSYSVNFRHLKFGQKCTAKWLLFRHQNYREVFFRFAHSARKNHLHPQFYIPSQPNRWHTIDSINNKTFRNSSPGFGCSYLSMLLMLLLVAHMACSNKIMKFHTEEIEIEKSLFKTFMYAHTHTHIGVI